MLLRRFLSILLILSLFCSPLAVAETSTSTSKYGVLKKGDRDISGEVTALQKRLIELHYLDDVADGIYGSATHSAICDFQLYNGLNVTGIADAATQTLLFEGDDSEIAPHRYDSKAEIYSLQEMLALWGFMCGSVDGISGTATEDGIVNFKRYLDTVYYELYPELRPEDAPAPSASTVFGDAMVAVDTPVGYTSDITADIMRYIESELDFEVFNQVLQSGDSGEEVYRVQRRLQQLGYIYSSDGDFGEATERALGYFQYKNNLEMTSIADEATQRLLFSDDAIESDLIVTKYKLIVDVSEQLVYVYQWNGTSYGTSLGTMICSTGDEKTPTPLGYYQAAGRSGSGEWYYFKDLDCYAKWGFHIVGDIMFHSVVYDSDKKLRTGTVSKLGTQASHGCIRLEEENAKWIYENCSQGTTVIIQE